MEHTHIKFHELKHPKLGLRPEVAEHFDHKINALYTIFCAHFPIQSRSMDVSNFITAFLIRTNAHCATGTQKTIVTRLISAGDHCGSSIGFSKNMPFFFTFFFEFVHAADLKGFPCSREYVTRRNNACRM